MTSSVSLPVSPLPIARIARLTLTFPFIARRSFFSGSHFTGLGQPAPIRSFSEALGSMPFYWLDRSGGIPNVDPNPPFTSQAIMDILTSQLSPSQRSQIQRLNVETDLAFACPQSFTGLSGCFGAVVFDSLTSDPGTRSTNYTLRFDPGLNKVNVRDNSGDIEKRMFPLQWALDSAIIQLQGGPNATGQTVPREQPFTHATQEGQSEDQRLSLLGGIETLVVLAFFIGMLGVVWHLPSSVSAERGSGMTALQTSMGCAQAPRIAAWLAGPALAYAPAYFVMGGIVSATLFTRTNPALTIFAHVLPGLACASWALFVSTFFARANVSAIVTTALAILFAIVGLLTKDTGEGAQVILGLLFPPASFVYLFLAIDRFEVDSRAAVVTGTAGGGGGTPIGQIIVNIVSTPRCPVARILYNADKRPTPRLTLLRSQSSFSLC